MQYQYEIGVAAETYKEDATYKGQKEKFDAQDVTIAFEEGAEWMFRNLWVSLDQESPDIDAPVVVRTRNGALLTTKRVWSSRNPWKGLSWNIQKCITHWMYIPRLPRK